VGYKNELYLRYGRPSLSNHRGNTELLGFDVQLIPELLTSSGNNEVEKMAKKLLRFGSVQRNRLLLFKKLAYDHAQNAFRLAR
ncbi:hypothetical protein ACC672_37475, partial [Rhizobium ruizarguesonis]